MNEFHRRHTYLKPPTRINASNCWLVEKDSANFFGVRNAKELEAASEIVWTKEKDSFNIYSRELEAKSMAAKYYILADLSSKLVDHTLIMHIMQSSFLELTNFSRFKYQDQLKSISIRIIRDLGIVRYSWTLQTNLPDQALFRTLLECMFLWLKSRGLITSPALFETAEPNSIVPISVLEYEGQPELAKTLNITFGFVHGQEFMDNSKGHQVILPNSDVDLGKYSIYFRTRNEVIDSPFLLMSTHLETFIKYPRLLRPSEKRPTYEIAIFNNEKVRSLGIDGGSKGIQYTIFMIEAEKIDEAFQLAMNFLKSDDTVIIGLKSFSPDLGHFFDLIFLIEEDEAELFEYQTILATIFTLLINRAIFKPIGDRFSHNQAFSRSRSLKIPAISARKLEGFDDSFYFDFSIQPIGIIITKITDQSNFSL